MHGEESRIQDGLEFPYMGRKVVDWHHARARDARLLQLITYACISDVDECTQNPCAKDEQCVNAPGKFECHCKDGYVKVGGSCKPGEFCSSDNIFYYP